MINFGNTFASLINKCKMRFVNKLPKDFNWKNYLVMNEDVARLCKTEKQAIAHYLTFGMRENRKYKFKKGYEKIPNDFDWKAYLELNEDLGNVYNTKEQAVAHFLRNGVYEKRIYKKVVLPSDFDWKACGRINYLIPDERFVIDQYLKKGNLKYKYKEFISIPNVLASLNEWSGYSEDSEVDVICYTTPKSASTTLENSFNASGCNTFKFHDNATLCMHILGLKKVVPYLTTDLLNYLKFQTKKPIYIFDAFREPLSRSVSGFFQQIALYMYELTKNTNVEENILYFEKNIAILIDYFHKKIATNNFNYAFDEYINCNIDIYTQPFCQYNRDVIVNDGMLNYIVLRFDNIANWEKRIRSIIKKPYFKLITFNDSVNKVYHNLYQQFKLAYRITHADLDRLMENNRKRFNYFYTRKERDELYKGYKKYICV